MMAERSKVILTATTINRTRQFMKAKTRKDLIYQKIRFFPKNFPECQPRKAIAEKRRDLWGKFVKVKSSPQRVDAYVYLLDDVQCAFFLLSAARCFKVQKIA
jgi:hypothetical protein